MAGREDIGRRVEARPFTEIRRSRRHLGKVLGPRFLYQLPSLSQRRNAAGQRLVFARRQLLELIQLRIAKSRPPWAARLVGRRLSGIPSHSIEGESYGHRLGPHLSLIHISEPTRQAEISYA